MTIRRVLLPGLTLPVDDYEALIDALPGSTAMLDTLVTPVTGTTEELCAAVPVPVAPYELVGHSIGGLAALEWAARHPEAVSRVVLLDPSTPFGEPVPAILGGRAGRVLVWVIDLLARSPRIARSLGRWGRRSLLRGYGVTEDPLPLARVDELLGNRAALDVVAAQVTGVPAIVARVRALLEAGASFPNVLVLSSAEGNGSDQRLTRELADALGAHVVTVPGGHLFPMTHPVSTAAAIS